MCGILGGVWSAGKLHNKKDKIDKALSLINHRGPDDQGMEIKSLHNKSALLGHARLSIIDLTTAGHQPMYSRDERFGLVFNGEIYNYLELKAELEKEGYNFNTKTDTEVLLTAWIAWGEHALKRFIGMFSFALYDFVKNKVYCARDAFGIKPFYFSITENDFTYCSEIPPLLELAVVQAEPNLQRSYDYLVFNEYDSNEQTFFKGIEQLRPAELVTISFDSNNKLIFEKKTWWSPEKIQPRDVSFDEAAKQVRELFLQSIKLHLRSDVPLGVALSGGLDSSAVACAVREVLPTSDLHTFSYISEDVKRSEEVWVDKVNEYVNAIPHKVYPRSNDLSAELMDMIKTHAEPFGSTSIYAQYQVFKKVREAGITVNLDGQGADEILAGYSGYPEQRLLSLLKSGKITQAKHFLNQWAAWPNRSKGNALKLLVQSLLPNLLYPLVRTFTGKPSKPKWLNSNYLLKENVSFKENRRLVKAKNNGVLISYLKKYLNKRTLPALLRHGDRNSMRFSIESRVPFLTIPLVEYLLSLPEQYLISNEGETKSIFRAAMEGVVPSEILYRKDKIGFETPQKVWLKQIENDVIALIDRSNVPFLNLEEIKSGYLAMSSGGSNFDWQVWRWVNYLSWYELYISQSEHDE